MRLIDADRLNKEIKDKFGYSSATAFVRNMQDLSQVEVFKHIMRLIETAPTIEERPTGEWIPVTTCDMTEEDAKELLDDELLDDYYDHPASYWQYNCRLPDDGQEVLVSTKWGVKIVTFYSDVDYGNYFEEYEDRYDVDAWMPLPEAYKRGQKNE